MLTHTLYQKVHPSSSGHDFIAHFVEFALLHEFASPSPACVLPALKRPLCEHPLFYMNAYEFEARPGVKVDKAVNKSGWQFLEERPGKFGFVAKDFGTSSELSFEINVTRSVQVSYMATYQRVFPVEMILPGCEQAPPIELDPIWEDRETSEKTDMFSPQDEVEDHVHVPCLKTGVGVVRFRALKGRFKIIRLLSC
jgi:hypothetical protein